MPNWVNGESLSTKNLSLSVAREHGYRRESTIYTEQLLDIASLATFERGLVVTMQLENLHTPRLSTPC